MNPSDYAPSDVLNAPALLYAGQGQPLTPYFVAVTTGNTFSIPTSAITYSLSTSGGGSCVVNGVTITGAFNLNGSGPLASAITIAPTTETVYVNYTLNNVVYNTPGYY
jgi:hypothetical protein